MVHHTGLFKDMPSNIQTAYKQVEKIWIYDYVAALSVLGIRIRWFLHDVSHFIVHSPHSYQMFEDWAELQPRDSILHSHLVSGWSLPTVQSNQENNFNNFENLKNIDFS